MSDKYILYDPAAFGASEIREDTRDAEIIRLRAENARLLEAVGLMTTMAPFMELDVNDPVGTAKTVWAEQEKLFQENARLREALESLQEIIAHKYEIGTDSEG